ncbi:MAG: Pyrrolo-quinoline quinone [Verrucomicrobiales bacterium]|nr:Pyrrolo-quinoline quinone [Verrucomicrobiales bacterium]
MPRPLPSLLFGLLLLPAASLPAQDWPQFRGPKSDGVVTAPDIPTRWSKTENVAWHVDLPGKGWSSPVLSGGRLYLTTAVAPGTDQNAAGPRSLRTLALDAATGKTLWDTEIFTESANTPAIHQKNSHASPTPILADGRIYVHFGHEGTACLDLDGKKIWDQRSLTYPPVHGGGASPLLVDGLVIFPCDGADGPFLAALKATDGSIAWRTPRGGNASRKFSFCTPALIEWEGHKQVVSPFSDAIAAYNPADGKEIWRVRYDGYSVIGQPAFGHGLIFFTTSYDAPVTYAVRPGGTGDVTATHVAWTQDKRAPNTPSILLHGKELYQVADNGIASCLDAASGKIHWQERTARTTSASPLLVGDTIYILDEYGTTTFLKTGLTFTKTGENKLEGERTLATPVPAPGALYIRTETGLYKIGK